MYIQSINNSLNEFFFLEKNLDAYIYIGCAIFNSIYILKKYQNYKHISLFILFCSKCIEQKCQLSFVLLKTMIYWIKMYYFGINITCGQFIFNVGRIKIVW